VYHEHAQPRLVSTAFQHLTGLNRRAAALFWDGYQSSKLIGGRRYWRIPVMEGEFLIEDKFGMQRSVGGGNFLVLGENPDVTLEATERAVEAMKQVRGAILPFPGGIVRSGSKVVSRYKFLIASTNDAYCPTLQGIVQSALPSGVNSVLEIVIDGLDERSVSGVHACGSSSGLHSCIRRIRLALWRQPGAV